MENEKIINELVSLWEREYPKQSTKTIYTFDWEVRNIYIKNIKTFTPRSILKAKRYRELMEEGTIFPPIVVIQKQGDIERYVLVDGFHRMWAYKSLGIETVTAYIGIRRKRKIEAQPEIFIDKGLYNSEGM
ncbi:MAG: ParB N-terminal domain-containing protein [Ignavibacteriales bacterium]